MKCDLFAPPRRDPRHTPATAALDLPFCLGCLAMFDAGLDTAAIAARMHEREGAVATAIRIAREARRVA